MSDWLKLKQCILVKRRHLQKELYNIETGSSSTRLLAAHRSSMHRCMHETTTTLSWMKKGNYPGTMNRNIALANQTSIVSCKKLLFFLVIARLP